MMKVQKIYLELLKAAIWGGELTNERVKELTIEGVNEVIRLAAFQGTGPLVFDQLLKLKDVETPDALRMQMKQQCMMSMMQQNAMMPLLSQAWKALTEAGIDPVLLKGFGLAQYYPQPHLRQWGDMDVYVGQKNYHLGCETLRAAFPGVKHMAEEGDDYKHYNFEFGNAVLEMHRISMAFAHPRDRRYYEKWEEQSLTKEGPKIEVGDLTITVPEDTFNVFFVFLHAWHHFIETGMNLKQMCDIAVILHAKRDVIDKNRLHEALKKLHLMEVWQQIMYILVKYLGVAKEECPYYTDKLAKRAELLFERIMQEGSSRRHEEINAEGVSYIKRKWITFQLRLADSRLVKPYAPKYARHMVVSDLLHGVERIVHGK
ncbi:MAG: nucleotidyltransferase family protein [Paludibacteraceae bacterium]|nr:nucleotidyltransferase family protein [Paludibacteraceae bacterium]